LSRVLEMAVDDVSECGGGDEEEEEGRDCPGANVTNSG
jgi:hypothetical protein